MENGNKGSRRSPPRFWLRPHCDLKWWNDFREIRFLKNAKKTLECQNVHFTFCVKSYDDTVIVNFILRHISR